MHDVAARRPVFVAGACTPDTAPTGPGLPSGGNEGQLLVICRVGNICVALPGLAIERVIPMAALTTLPDAPHGIAGILNVGGAVLAVMDPRPRLGQPSPEFHPDQRLI